MLPPARMDVQLIGSSALDLPSSQRVDAIFYDGSADLRTWPGPGPDRELNDKYGAELQSVLTRQRDRLEGGLLPIGEMLRLHRGKLHCDFLLWISTRGAEVRGVRAAAPAKELITAVVKDALAFASLRHVARVALPALGAGPDELDDTTRLVLVAKAANAYYDDCYAAGRAAVIEEVLICHPSQNVIASARRQLGVSVKIINKPAPPAPKKTPARRRTAASGGTRKTTTRKVVAKLSDEDIARARSTGGSYDRTLKYEEGETMIHSKFGVGRVEAITAEGFIMVLFEGGETKRLLHNRP